MRTISSSRCLTKHNASLETAKVISSCNKKKKIPTIMSLQYELFPGGQPSRYYPRPTGFNFGDRTSPSFFSLWCDRRQETFVKSLTYCRSQRKHGQPSTITNHVQFLTKYSKRLKDKPLSKHYRVNLDLDDLKKARYPRMPQRLTERVLMFSLCCYGRQETSVNLGLFQTTSNYSWFLCFSCYGFS